MCGFAALIALHGAHAERAVVERMNGLLVHRGPDDAGIEMHGDVGFAFRRLSILDLSPAGHQPMSSPDGALTIVFNGEIYNYAELRKELEGLGHRFRSSGDTEVLLMAYRAWGEQCLDKLNGMWAFLIHDRARRIVFGSRDRFGIKPLYFHRAGERILFASEIKAIRDSGLYEFAPNWRIASEFLLENRLDETSETFYQGIRQIPAGHAIRLGIDGELKQWRYWRVHAPSERIDDPADAFADLFEDSMRLHMRSDVPVGVHLSGGLDSTSIICASARLRGADGARGPLTAFCYMAREFDESSYIADTVAQTGALLQRLATQPRELWDSVPDVLWYQDEPMHSMTPLIGYALMGLTAAHGIKVILNGQGADETLAGYGSYFRDYWHGLLSRGAVIEAWQEMGRHAQAHGGERGPMFMRQLRHFVQSQLGRLGAYRKLAAERAVARARSHPWFSDELCSHFDGRDGPHYAADLNDSLARSIEVDPLPIYLRVEDRNSMAHSVEARVPFLDHRLVTFAHGLPENWKLRGPWNKYLLREAMRGRIPESVRTRVDKMGFPTPAARWFREDLREPILDVLHRQATRERGIYRLDRIMADLERHRKAEIDVSSELFRIAQLEIWFDMHRKGERMGAASSHDLQTGYASA